MTGLVVSIQRQQGRAQSMQAQAIRMAVWGESEAFADFTEQLHGRKPAAHNDVDAALAAFGLRAE
jgi:hypothetical protein